MQTIRLVRYALLFVCAVSTCKAAYPQTGAFADGTSAKTQDSPPPTSRAPKSPSEGGIQVGVGLSVSSLGVGGEVAIPVIHRANVRVGFHGLGYSHTFDKDGVSYKGSLDLRSAEALFDFYPFKSFHLSPGVLFYNGNKISANASVPGGDSFTLNSVSYTSDPADPIVGTGKMSFYKAAPMFLFGFGNLVPRSKRRFSVSFDVGAAYQGPPRATLAFTGSACDASGANCASVVSDPAIQSNIAAEQSKINKSVAPFRFYPILSFGIGYKF